MKIIYINCSRIPTEKAHGLQIMKMCEAIATASSARVELWVPRRLNAIKQDPFEYYGIRKNFCIRRIPCADFLMFDKFLGPAAFWLLELSFLFFAVFALTKSRADVIYTRDAFAVFFLSFFKKNIFYEAHDVPAGIFFPGFKKVRGVIAITKNLKDEFIRRGVRAEKIIVAPDGVDLDEFNIPESKEECRKILGLPSQKKIILYAGHLYPWKGADTLFEAAQLSIINYQLSTPLFYFVGGTERDVVKFRRKTRGLNNVKVIGHRPHKEIPYWLRAVDVLVLPNSAKYDISKYWTSPLKLFEYMASGVPIVASDLPSIREILNESNAFFVEPDNPVALVGGIEKLLSDGLLGEKIAQQAIQDAHGYTWQKRAVRILRFIKMNNSQMSSFLKRKYILLFLIPVCIAVFGGISYLFVFPQKLFASEKIYDFLEHPQIRDLAYSITQARNSLIKLDGIAHVPYWFFYESKLPKYSITINSDNLLAMEEALPEKRFSSGLLEKNKKFVNAVFNSDDYSENVEIRYRGGSGGHWNNSKRSLLVKFPKESLFSGMKSIDFITPRDRAYFVGLLNTERIRKLGLANRRRFAVRLKINDKDAGVYIARERFSSAWLGNSGVPDESEVFSQSGQLKDAGINSGWRVDIHEDNPSHEALETLFTLHESIGWEKFYQMLDTIFDLDKWYSAMALNILAGSPHSFGANLNLFFNSATGKFEPLLEDINIYPPDTHPGNSIYEAFTAESESFDGVLNNYILSEDLPYEQFRNRLREVSSKSYMEEDILYYDYLTSTLTPEFYKDLTKNRGDRYFSNYIKKVREFIGENYKKAQRLSSQTKPPLEIQEYGAGDGFPTFPGSFMYLYDAVSSPEEFVQNHPSFIVYNKNIVLPTGTYTFDDNIIIPGNSKLIIQPGTKIYLSEKVSLVSYSPIIAEAEPNNPITIGRKYLDRNWGAVAVINTNRISKFEYVTMIGGSSSDLVNGVIFTGMLSAHNAPLEVRHSQFYRDLDEDAINVKYATGIIEDSEFFEMAGDAIDLDMADDFMIRNNGFYEIGTGGGANADAIDMSFSDATIMGNTIRNCGDKGISVGERSNLKIYSNSIHNCKVGIAVKDSSHARIKDNLLQGNEEAIALYQKKQIFGGAQATAENNTLIDNEANFFVDENSNLILRQDAL